MFARGEATDGIDWPCEWKFIGRWLVLVQRSWFLRDDGSDVVCRESRPGRDPQVPVNRTRIPGRSFSRQSVGLNQANLMGRILDRVQVQDPPRWVPFARTSEPIFVWFC